jgi:hypothetical protein
MMDKGFEMEMVSSHYDQNEILRSATLFSSHIPQRQNLLFKNEIPFITWWAFPIVTENFPNFKILVSPLTQDYACLSYEGFLGVGKTLTHAAIVMASKQAGSWKLDDNIKDYMGV